MRCQVTELLYVNRVLIKIHIWYQLDRSSFFHGTFLDEVVCPSYSNVSLKIQIIFDQINAFLLLLFCKKEDVIQLKCNLQSSELNERISVEWKNKCGEWESVSYVELSEDELKKEWVCLRTKFQLKFAAENSEELLQQLQATKTKICEINKPILYITSTEIILKKEKGLVGIGKNAKISAAVQQAKTQQNISADATDGNANKLEILHIKVAGAGEDDAIIDDISALFSSEFSTDVILTFKSILIWTCKKEHTFSSHI